jgi:hypothetical protein
MWLLAAFACALASMLASAGAALAVAGPTVTSLSPTSGSVDGGTVVVITGTNFVAGASTSVAFGSGNAATTFMVNSATQITVTAPAAASSAGGNVDVTVTTGAGTSATNSGDLFTYVPHPTVTGVSPAAGPIAGGTTVTITGTNMGGVTKVDFGTVQATGFSVVSSTEITAPAPAQSAGTVPVTVIDPVGGSSAASSAGVYTYDAVPTVTGVSPATGPTAGGTSVTITGTGLTGATSVRFGTAAATNLNVLSATQLTATSPASAAGAVNVIVTTPGGTSATSASDAFTYANPVTPPAVAQAAPSVQNSTGAAFSGAVNPEGLPTSAQFQYGLDPKYNGGGPVVYTDVTPAETVGSDTAIHPITATVTGLVPNAVYHVRLVAANSDGTTDGVDQTFMTPPGPPAAAPVIGQSAVVNQIAGLVYIKFPHGGSAADAESVAFAKGQGFVPLTEARNIPSGSQIDATRGTLTLTSATTAQKRGKLQTVTLSGGIFSFTQSKSGITKGLATLSLLENDFPGAPSYSECPRPAADGGSGASAAKASPKILQSLTASDKHGKFQTKGRYSAATVRGTSWITEDRCDGTLTIVKRGTVSVFDTKLRKTVTVRAGHSYLAQAIQTPKKGKGKSKG